MEYVERGSAKKYVYMKQRIAKTQRSARAIGLLYLFATLLLTALTCLSLVLTTNVENESAKLSVMHFWKAFKEIKNFRFVAIPLITSALYGITLFVLLCNVLRSLSKLNWLFKRKASRVYGFNRNAYAMDDLGNAFSSSFTCVLVNHFLIALLDFICEIQISFWICVSAGLLVHFLCGVCSGNISLFDIQSGIVEDERQVGSFSPLIRNLFQIAGTALAAVWFLKYARFGGYVYSFIVDFSGTFSVMKADMQEILYFATETVIVLLVIGMVIYALGRKEYDMDGREAPGRKAFLLLSFLATAATVFYYVYFKSEHAGAREILMTAIFVGAAFVMDLVLTAFPLYKRRYHGDEVNGDDYLYGRLEKHGR
jgi:hypothetical protein